GLPCCLPLERGGPVLPRLERCREIALWLRVAAQEVAYRFAGLRQGGTDIDQMCHAVVVRGGTGNHSTTVRVADQDGRLLEIFQRVAHCRGISLERSVRTAARKIHGIYPHAALFQFRDYFVPRPCSGEGTVHEKYGLGHTIHLCSLTPGGRMDPRQLVT